MDTIKLRTLAGLYLLPLLLAGWSGAQAASVTIINANTPGVGFNDPTPAAPVGGNSGVTLGEQRLIAFTYAAEIWGSKLDSPVPIRVQASFQPLSCTASSAVLGSAGAASIYADFPGAQRSNTWYPGALAAKLAGADQDEPGDPHLIARFNSRLGLFPDCLPGSPFYLGLDNHHGSQVDLVTVLLHEMAHGLGFQTYTDEQSGEFYFGTPSIWDHHLTDNRNGKTWVMESAAERAASSVSGDGLSWDGAHVNAAVPVVLSGESRLIISGNAAGPAAGTYQVGDAAFGPPLANPPLTGQVMPVVDQPDGAGLACTALSPANALAVDHNIGLVDRGGCNFTVKAKNLQDAGATGMIVIDNVAGPVTGLGGSDPSVTIPAVRVSQADGNLIRASLQHRSRTMSGVIASLGVDTAKLAGTDAGQRVLMYTPLEYEPGSSVSHYSTDAKPNQLMEPALNADLRHQVEPPRDLTLPLLRDIGW
ncbi:PA domain-containing protein [Janthinobacterium agaricidamnosum]|uniref:PA domain protein n=1 Tax=Janthinobacterium agaricidamnosum NBRC 102515 = DSM 9628 TaxID=1349767 RepID=W0VBX6_9BURK|nr:PA domain-containing protein [Janthinobacterium agaricidamnosum]CDG84858.1 PA domain protein [Janthinobacterium agaricidamnosum NBRC 102515 = DSM 9628]